MCVYMCVGESVCVCVWCGVTCYVGVLLIIVETSYVGVLFVMGIVLYWWWGIACHMDCYVMVLAIMANAMY